MTVKIQLRELKDIVPAISQLIDTDIPTKPSYWLGKLAKKIQSEAKHFDEARYRLVEKYALRDADNKLVSEDGRYQFGDNTEAFNKEFAELADTEIEIDFKPLALNSLIVKDKDGNEVGGKKPKIFIPLDKFIHDDDDDQ